jgi:hypothetical protein
MRLTEQQARRALATPAGVSLVDGLAAGVSLVDGLAETRRRLSVTALAAQLFADEALDTHGSDEQVRFDYLCGLFWDAADVGLWRDPVVRPAGYEGTPREGVEAQLVDYATGVSYDALEDWRAGR